MVVGSNPATPTKQQSRPGRVRQESRAEHIGAGFRLMGPDQVHAHSSPRFDAPTFLPGLTQLEAAQNQACRHRLPTQGLLTLYCYVASFRLGGGTMQTSSTSRARLSS